MNVLQFKNSGVQCLAFYELNCSIHSQLLWWSDRLHI